MLSVVIRPLHWRLEPRELDTSGQIMYVYNLQTNNIISFVLIIFLVLKFILVNQPTVQWRGVSRGRVCGCGCWRCWQVTGDRWQVTHVTWQVTHDTWFFLYIGATFLTHWEIQFLLYVGLFIHITWAMINLIFTYFPNQKKIR